MRYHITILLILLFGFTGSAVFAQNVVINEINYRSIDDGNAEFVELYNNESFSVDLSGWTLSDGIEYTFPNGTSIGPDGLLVIAADPGFVQLNLSFNTTLGPFQGGLSSNGDVVRLLDNTCLPIDKVSYKSWNEWPSVRHHEGQYVSIQKINPKLPGNQPGSWSSSYPTANTINYSVFVVNSNDIPVIKDVTKSPNKPMEGEDVRIRADFSQDNDVFLGPLNVKLEYQVNVPGDYKLKNEIAWNSITMLDDGIGADSTANNGVYTAIIPGSTNQHRRLIRYRIIASTGMGQDRIYPDPRFKESNYAYFVYNGFPMVNGYDLNTLNEMQDLMVITKSSISSFYIGNKDTLNTITNQYQGGELLGEGTLVYNGKVYDHINFRPRGKGSRPERNKPGIKFGLNKEHPVLIETDCGESYKVARDKLILSGTWVNDMASHGLTESLVYKVTELSGGLPRYTDYAQVHIIDNGTETGNAVGDFFGLFLIMEDYNGDYLKEHKFAEGNFWGTNRTTRHRFLDYQGDFPAAAMTPTFAPFDTFRGTFTVDYRGHLPLLFGDRIGAEINGLNGNNYIGKHSYNEYFDSATQSYLAWWGDMDNTFGSPFDDVTVFPRIESDFNAPNKGAMIIPNNMQIEYQNEFRSVYDLLLDYTDPDCNCTQSDYLVDQESKKIFTPDAAYDWTTVDKSRWAQSYDLGNYASHQNWYKTWFQGRKSYLTAYFDDIDIPTKPTITASNSIALDQLIFGNSAFSDLQGASTFAALEWRVGEWSDPSNPYYDQECEAKYEIETKWRSGEITSFTSSFQIPAEAKLKKDRTYLIRVRYKDDSGKWSHWSHPQKVVPTPAANPIDYGLVINEIMYNPRQPSHAEFIEIYNSKPTTVSLDNVQFNEGIDFEFAPGSSIGPESYICIAKDSFEFFKAYGYYPYSDYGGGLSNSGELIRLAGAFRTIIDTVRYNDKAPWPSTPDQGIYSLALKNTDLPNEDGNNWGIQSQFVTPCQANQFNNLGTHPYSGIVINEIHYNPFDELDAEGNVIESGTKFEFIELKNISITPIDMTGVFFSRGIDYAFDPGTFINPGEFFVLAEDRSSFLDRYGFEADDKYSGKLSNSGEVIWLTKSTGILMDAVTYGISFPWDSKANGGQKDLSLALIDGNVDNHTRLNWATQCTQNYTPGAENDFDCFPGLDFTGLTINEIHHSPSGGSSLEYIEIINNSNSVLNLEEVALKGGILFVFDPVYLPPKIASPNNYLVIANDVVAFQNEYGFAPHGEFTGVLSNNGETLILQDLFEVQIDIVNYQEMVTSNPAASQGSHSIALINPDLENNMPESWCTQDVSLSPKSENTFSDSDADSIIDCLDACPGSDDSADGDGDGIPDGCDDLFCIADEAVIGTDCVDTCYDNTINASCDCIPANQIALQGTASMSSQYGSLAASNLINGVINDDSGLELASTSGVTSNDWMEIDLGINYMVKAVAIKNRLNCCSDRLSNAYLMASSTPFPSHTDLTAALANAEFVYQIGDATNISHIGVDVNINARYVRVQKSGNNGSSNIINLREIEIFTIDNSPTILDADNDGVCDGDDICAGFDDTIDVDNNGIPDECEGCVNSIVENSNPLINEDLAAKISILTNGKTAPSATIEYTAGEFLEFTSGFEVELGTVFHAFIEPCN